MYNVQFYVVEKYFGSTPCRITSDITREIILSENICICKRVLRDAGNTEGIIPLTIDALIYIIIAMLTIVSKNTLT